MIRLSFHNLPFRVFMHRVFSFKPELIVSLRQAVASAIGCFPEEVEINLVKSECFLLRDDSYLEEAAVYVEVDGHPDIEIGGKRAISDALYEFLKFYSLEGGLKISFRTSPVGTFFAEKEGKILPVTRTSKKAGINYWPYHDHYKPNS